MKSIYVLNIFFLTLTTGHGLIPQPRCFGDLGCFSGFLVNVSFPKLNYFAPRSPEELKIKFKLYTEANGNDSIDFDYKADPSKLQNSHFDARLKTVFIIHGFKSSFDANGWNGKLKDKILLLNPGKYNVIGIDWSAGAKTFNYFQAVADTSVVGATLAKFILKLKAFLNLKLSNVHLIGHSLGAHISGSAGFRIQNETGQLVGRITALDPAGPFFKLRPRSERLDRFDATYVDILHTDAANIPLQGLGLTYAVGSIDYFVNGGSLQPGCGITNIFSALKDFGISQSFDYDLACSHSFAHKLVLVDSKYSPTNCEFIAYQCDSYQKFLDGRCTDCEFEDNKCKAFSIYKENDFNPVQVGKKYFFNTAEKPPYCLFHYGITLDISIDSKPSSGIFKLNIQGDEGILEVDGKTGIFTRAEPGYKYSALITSEKSLGPIRKVTSSFRRNFGLKHPKVKIDMIDIKFMSSSNAGIREAMSAIMCREVANTDSDGETIFVPCEDDESE